MPNDQNKEICTAKQNSIRDDKPNYSKMELWISKTDPLNASEQKLLQKRLENRFTPHSHTWIRYLIAAKLPALFPLLLPRQSETTHLAFFPDPETMYPQKNANHSLLEVRIFEELNSSKKTHCFRNNWEKENSFVVQCAIYIKDLISFFLCPSANEIHPTETFFFKHQQYPLEMRAN